MVDENFDRRTVGSDRGGRSYLAQGLPALGHCPRASSGHYRSRPFLVVGVIHNQILTFFGLCSYSLICFSVWRYLVDLTCDPEVVHMCGKLWGECDDRLAFPFSFCKRKGSSLEFGISFGETTCMCRWHPEIQNFSGCASRALDTDSF